jgi:minor extracellular protease Epr
VIKVAGNIMKLHRLYAVMLLVLPLHGQSQVLTTAPLQQVLPQQVAERLQRTTEQVKQQAMQQQQQLRQQLAEKAALPDPLTSLPAVLDVVDQTGQLRWREVEVEQGFRAVEREWLLLLSAAEWQQLSGRWPQLQQYLQSATALDALGLLMIKLKVPAVLDSSAALNQQFNQALAQFAGRNHIYQPQSEANTANTAQQTDKSAAMCVQPVKLGMVDTAIALDHPALAQQSGRLRIEQQNFLPPDMAQAYNHGTAIAGLLAAQHSEVPALLPQLQLYSASAFYPSNNYQQSATLAHILQALNWLVSQQVNVINMSLTGPANPVLQATIAHLAQQQVVLIAAAGNAGPAAPALFPAAYPQVLAVTAVDKQLQLYRWANQGEYIDYAAVGVRVPTLSVNGTVVAQSGTSIATPVVSAAVGCLRAMQPDLTLPQIRQALTQQARDLGEPGKDNQFGYGLISSPLKTELK